MKKDEVKNASQKQEKISIEEKTKVNYDLKMEEKHRCI